MANWIQTKPLAGSYPPPPIESVINTLRSVIQTLVALLTVADTILNIIKVFALGLQNPLAIILQALIAQIKNILNDLQRAGVYIHGDYYDLKWPFEELRGGFNGFEQRMIRRLTDPTDPERPIFSNSSQTIALFLYLKADATGVYQVVQFILQLIQLFGKGDDTPAFPSVVNTEIGYGWENLTAVSFPLEKGLKVRNVVRNGIPTVANMTWALRTTGRFSGIRRFAPPISGFLIEISVYENGLIPVYSSPVPSNTDRDGIQNQQYGRYLDNRKNPIILYGGADQIDAQNVSYNNNVNASGILPGQRVAYLVRNLADPTPIPLDLLKDGQDYLLQRTFYVKSTASRILYANQKFTFRLSAEDLPFNANFEVTGSGNVRVVPGSKERAKTAYIRIRPVGPDIEDEATFKYQFRPVVTTPAYAIPTQPIGSSVGDPYGPYQVTFPAEADSTYFTHMRAAMIVLALSRPDLDPELYGVTGLESLTDLQSRLTGRSFRNFYSKADTSSQFRQQLSNRVDAAISGSTSYLGTLSDNYKNSVTDRTQILVDWKWEDVDPTLPAKTITESVENRESIDGVARNINSVYDLALPENAGAATVVSRLIRARNGININPALTPIQSTIPVIVGAGGSERSNAATRIVAGSIRDVRTVIPEEVYDAAALILRAANVPYARVPGGWIQVRFFQQSIPGIGELVQTLLGFLEELEQGISGIIEALVDYIEFLQSRVRELSELLLRIDAYLQSLLLFEIPQVNALLITDAQGTQGIVNELVGAGNKPLNDPNEYVGGIVLVSGGLPTFIVDILKAVTG